MLLRDNKYSVFCIHGRRALRMTKTKEKQNKQTKQKTKTKTCKEALNTEGLHSESALQLTKPCKESLYTAGLIWSRDYERQNHVKKPCRHRACPASRKITELQTRVSQPPRLREIAGINGAQDQASRSILPERVSAISGDTDCSWLRAAETVEHQQVPSEFTPGFCQRGHTSCTLPGRPHPPLCSQSRLRGGNHQ